MLQSTLPALPMPLTSSDVLTFLWIVVALMLVVVLYHVLFIVVDLRRIVRRMEDLTAQVESILLKPLSLLDDFFRWTIVRIEKRRAKKGGKSAHGREP